MSGARYLELPQVPRPGASVGELRQAMEGAFAALMEYSRGRDSPVPFQAQPGVNAASGASATLNLRGGLIGLYKVTLTDNCTLAVTGTPRTPNVYRLTVVLKQDGTGSRTVTWWSGVKWAGGAAPTLTTTAAAEDIFEFVTFDGGTVWYGRTIGLAMA